MSLTLEKRQADEVDSIARQLRVSTAWVIRSALEQYLARRASPDIVAAVRYQNQSTTANARALIEAIKNQQVERVTLFSSPTAPTADFSAGDSPEANLPLVSSLAELSLPQVGKFLIVFDGLFLTAARYPRYMEVEDLLDEAQDSGKVFFSTERAPFTSGLLPDLAASRLRAMPAERLLTRESRPEYFALLSTINEEKYKALYRGG